MNKLRWSWIFTVLLIAIGLTSCGSQAPPTPEESGIPVVVDELKVIVDGRLNPIESVRLSFKNGGSIAAVLVEEGDQIEAGQVLVQLAGGEQFRAAVAAAQLELASSQQAMRTLLDSAEFRAAQAQLNLANARDVLKDAEREWRNQQEGNRASSTTIDAAEAELALAQESKDWAEKVAHSCGSSHDADCAQEYKDYAAAVQREWRALANLNWYTGHPTEIDQAILDGEVALAKAQLAEAEREWNAWAAGPDPEELSLVEARLSNAGAQLAAAKAALRDLEILAPISGVVADLPVKAGELVALGQLGVVLADFSGWMVSTENLTEIDVPQVALDQMVEVSFDALPDLTLPGTVSAISPAFELRGGDVIYTVEIELLESHPGLVWGMTTVVKFGEIASGTASALPGTARIGH